MTRQNFNREINSLNNENMSLVTLVICPLSLPPPSTSPRSSGALRERKLAWLRQKSFLGLKVFLLFRRGKKEGMGRREGEKSREWEGEIRGKREELGRRNGGTIYIKSNI